MATLPTEEMIYQRNFILGLTEPAQVSYYITSLLETRKRMPDEYVDEKRQADELLNLARQRLQKLA